MKKKIEYEEEPAKGNAVLWEVVGVLKRKFAGRNSGSGQAARASGHFCLAT